MSREEKQMKGGMRKGLLEFAVLLIISRGRSYSSEIIEKLSEKELLIVEGTLYPLLNRLLKHELLSYSWEESESGPPRKYYELTDSGKTRLEELKKEWAHLEKSINSLSE